MVKKIVQTLGYAAAAGSASFAGQAMAQAVERPIPVLPSDYPTELVGVSERYRPEFEAPGVSLGSFNLSPQVGAGLGYISNVYGRSFNKADDFYAAINPSLTLSRRGGAATEANLSATLSANLRRFFNEKSANETAMRALANGSIPVGNVFTVSGGGGFERAYERQEAGSFPTAARSPIKVDELTGFLRVRAAGARLRVTAGVDVRDQKYGDARLGGGLRTDQGFRDLTLLRGVGRVESSLTGAVSAFVEGRYTDVNYNRQFISAGVVNRDGGQAEGYLGIRVDAGKLRGVVSGGYTRRTFDSPTYRNFGGLAVDGELTYYASGLTTYTLEAHRNINENGDPGVTAMFNTGARLRVDHELLRYIILSGNVGYDAFSYKSISRTDKVASVGGGVRYLANRHFEINADVNYLKRTSNLPLFGTEFNRFQGVISLVARL
ncbi:outer membrane beta-barrel protein [Sphingobium phenoxybenzoativorans]|uniref:Outer membrane beta-barrel protein n=1 Tax=Sphingobium phenoxybenzoativorans TaxID=1592790 RepID=A0A975K7T9_9SPHN|nr:outer membrane beta-barrel protein [Sphingobium phenoxybenzoativorans]QUT05673.1 outer membrane beta-barrel protein [Sphingobium phenoxybenzoativorans]